jgi:hypothetical protein
MSHKGRSSFYYSRHARKYAPIEQNLIVLNNAVPIKPPREVSLRVKFIRLGEVSEYCLQ